MTKIQIITQLAQAYAQRRRADEDILRLEGALALIQDQEAGAAKKAPDTPPFDGPSECEAK